MLQIAHEVAAEYGGEDALRARVVAFQAALEAHRLTVDEAAPTEDPLVEQLARVGDSFEVLPVPVPPPPPPPAPVRAWSMSEFKLRLTSAEKVALGRLLSRTDLTDTDCGLLFDFVTASTLSLDDPKFRAGLARLQALGVITDARRLELLQPT